MQERGYLQTLVIISFIDVIVCLNCRTQFEIMKVCQRKYGQVLLQTNTSSVTACSTLCASDLACRSVMYDPVTTSCTLNTLPKDARGYYVNLPVDCHVLVYYVIVERQTCVDVWMLDACESDADCTQANSTCSSTHYTKASICRCASGYNHNSRNDTCLAGCETYGNGFTQDTYYIENSNFAELEVQTQIDCLKVCLFSYGAQCRHVHFVYIPNAPDHCYLSAETALTKPNDKKRNTNPSAFTFNRDCA